MSMYSLGTKKIDTYSWLKSFSTRSMAFKRRQSIDHFKKKTPEKESLGACFACISKVQGELSAEVCQGVYVLSHSYSQRRVRVIKENK